MLVICPCESEHQADIQTRSSTSKNTFESINSLYKKMFAKRAYVCDEMEGLIIFVLFFPNKFKRANLHKKQYKNNTFTHFRYRKL